MAEPTIIGVDLGGTKVSAGAVTGGKADRVAQRDVPADEAANVVFETIAETIQDVLDETVVGIGCGVPSVVDVDAGIVFDVENIPSWKQFGLKEALEERFGIPAYVNNDANAFVVGEFVYGKGRGYQDLVGMTLGTGLGTGVVIKGKLYSGSNCGAGEIGMMAYKGLTLEEYCSGPFFQRVCGESGEAIYRRARDGDIEAKKTFFQYGRQLAEAVQIALYAYDPQAVIFGGSISFAFDLFEGGLREGLASFSYQRVLERLVIDRSELDNAAVLGAAALYVDAIGGGTN